MDNLTAPLYPLVNTYQCESVLCIDNGFTKEEVDVFLKQMSEIEAGAAIVGGPPTKDENIDDRIEDAWGIRKSNVYFLNVYSAKYKWIYDKMVSYVNYINDINFKKTLYGIEPMQYTEYDSNYQGFYGTHKDEEYTTMRPLRRSLSFSVQLTDPSEFTGGDFIIYDGHKQTIANKQLGSITFFDSIMQHEVKPVTSGFRRSLVGWVNGPRV